MKVLSCLITRPSRAATCIPICISTFCIAKSVVIHATFTGSSDNVSASIIFLALTILLGVIQPASSLSSSSSSSL
ncbi:GSCOCG00007460001-RA-CDS [Cotesia congregata]|nr:GSCOCG00007460001-RA-CDS [Cotesia congregata]